MAATAADTTGADAAPVVADDGPIPTDDGIASAATEDATATNAAAAASSSSGPALPKPKRTTDDELHDWMEKLRGRCVVLESNSQAQTAVPDAQVSVPDVQKPTSPALIPPAAGLAGTEARPGPLQSPHWEDGCECDGCEDTATTEAPPRKAKHTSDGELHNWMEHLRAQCQVLESSSPAHVVIPDAQASRGNDESSKVEEVRQGGKGRKVNRSMAELDGWMTAMRNQCKTFESTPGETSADARNDDADRYVGATRDGPSDVETEVQVQGNHAKAIAQGVLSSEPPPASEPQSLPGASPDLDELCEQLRAGSPLPDALRARIWAKKLGVQPETIGVDTTKDEAIGHAPITLIRILGGDDAEADEEVLFDASGGGGATAGEPTPKQLAAAFTEKYFRWLFSEPQKQTFFAVIAQLLRYHHPSAAGAILSIATPAGLDLTTALSSVCGGPCALAELLLAQREASALLCDLTVINEEEEMLVFVVVALLGLIPRELDCTFEQLGENVRGVQGLGSLEGRGASRCMADAHALLQATPVSLSNAIALGSRHNARLLLPMCAVAPDEVLHHIYEKPPGAWRLVVVDTRMRPNGRGLPVSLRLEPDHHSSRRQVLRELPYEEAIHLCLMGDGPPAPGDDAAELCRYLLGPRVRRKHVSVVDGGWPAVEELASSLGLHLMPLDAAEVSAARGGSSRGGGGPHSGGGHSGLRVVASATETAAAVSQQVAVATETAAAAAQLHARRALAGVGRALRRLPSSMPASSTASEPLRSGPGPTPAGEAERG